MKVIHESSWPFMNCHELSQVATPPFTKSGLVDTSVLNHKMCSWWIMIGPPKWMLMKESWKYTKISLQHTVPLYYYFGQSCHYRRQYILSTSVSTVQVILFHTSLQQTTIKYYTHVVRVLTRLTIRLYSRAHVLFITAAVLESLLFIFRWNYLFHMLSVQNNMHAGI